MEEAHAVDHRGLLSHKKFWTLSGFALFIAILSFPTPGSLYEVVRENEYAERMFVDKKIVGNAEDFLYFYEMGRIDLSEEDRETIDKLLMKAENKEETIKLIDERILSNKEWREKIAKSDAWLDHVAKEAAFKAKVVIALVLLAVVFFATEAVPIGAAAMLIPLAGYVFTLDGPTASDIAKNFMGDAVFFILGVLALGYIVAEVGLHSRIAASILGWAHGFRGPIFAIAIIMPIVGAFISAHALAAFLAPVMASIYYGSVRAASKKGEVVHDPVLAKMLLLTLTWAMNVGGVGSPAAGARNAIMLQYFEHFGVQMSFAQWMMYGLPMVPVLGLAVALYAMTVFKPRVRNLTPGIEAIKEDIRRRGPMSTNEKLVAVILVITIVGWIFGELFEIGGMGAASLFAMLAPVFLRIVNWEKMLRGIAWDAWFVYIGALGLGAFMKETGAALWIARSFMDLISGIVDPQGLVLWVFVSLLSGIITNFMSDAATTALLGPITIPMGILSGNPAEPWAVGLATAFATSFAHVLVIGTPNNVIVYALGRYPDTGERMLSASDFIKYGMGMLLLSLVIMWIVTFVLVFSIVGFPEGLLERAVETIGVAGG
ncbi:SLC13 family permease [Candidatus Pyrohabitans sp.]